MQLRLVDKFPETDDVVTFVFEPSEAVTWVAGQFLKYSLPHDHPDDRGNSRWFTIAAPPYEGKPRITTRLSAARSSSFKTALNHLPVGATIEATRPSGDFVADDPSRPMVFIAGGIGITPYRAILLQLDHDNVDMRVRLLYANRNENVAFKDELDAIAVRRPGFAVSYFTDPKHIELTDITQAGAAFTNPLYYLSGPEPMVEQYKDKLVGAGIAEENVRTDYFHGYD